MKTSSEVLLHHPAAELGIAYETDGLTMDRPIAELYKAFHLLNKHLYESVIDEPAILIQNQGTRSKNKLGWVTTTKIWINDSKEIMKYELNITAEYLNRSIHAVLGTLVHEMVHLYCLQHNIQDTSRSGNYHNKAFKKEAERIGLVVDKTAKDGYAFTAPTSQLEALFSTLPIDSTAFTLKRDTWGLENDEEEEPKKKKKKKVPNAQWACLTCMNLVVESNDKVNLICGDCMNKYEKLDTEDPEKDE